VDQIVLVVVDDPALRASLKFALEIEGYRVRVFGTADELFGSGSFPEQACLVVDYVLPQIDGIEITATLRARGVNIPTIVMTSDPSDLIRAQARSAGLILVEKPFFGDGLAEAIRAARTKY